MIIIIYYNDNNLFEFMISIIILNSNNKLTLLKNSNYEKINPYLIIRCFGSTN